MWTAWLRAIGEDGAVVLAEPAVPEVLADVEAKLGSPLLEDLRSLLAESDGLADDSGGEPVWPVERIGEENAARLGPVADADADLVFFGDTGTEDLFAYRAAGPDIYLWCAADGKTRWVASDLRSLLDTWFADEA
ncbi:MAG: SMI1/KNR4 family protein [Sporichthyaceae bacterium]